MKVERYAPAQEASAFATLRRAALVAICAVLAMVLGIGVPYKIYKHIKAKQDAAAAVSLTQEEL